MPNKNFNIGSASFNINSQELKSVGRGLAIAVGGALATEITRQLTGANFVLNWNDFHVGAFFFAAGSYNYTALVWAGWSALLNFARKFITDNTQKPQ